MATLVSALDLATWTRKDLGVIEDDPFATMVLERATELVTAAAQIPPEWESDATLVPGRARTICLMVAARTYLNPRSVVSSSVGPLSERVLNEAAAGMYLTDLERSELEALVPALEEGYRGLWVLPTTRGDEVLIDTIYLPDDSGSDWLIPYGDNWQTDALNPEVP